jgi:hypothetical protein
MEPVVRLETQAPGCGSPGNRTVLVAQRILIPKPSGEKERRKVSKTIVLSEGKEARAASSIRDIPLENIRKSASNPRRAFDDRDLRELAENSSHGRSTLNLLIEV